jgi:hypothetical protein
LNFVKTEDFEAYVDTIKEYRKGKGRDFEVIPKTTISKIGQITLDTIPRPIGAGYHFDSRSIFRIYFNRLDLRTSWTQGEDNSVENIINHNKKIDLSALSKELQLYWKTNSILEHRVDSIYNEDLKIFRKSGPLKLAVWIDPDQLPLSDFEPVLQEICRSYVSYIKNISEEIYNLDICSLPEVNVEIIKEKLPLRISFIRTSFDKQLTRIE